MYNYTTINAGIKRKVMSFCGKLTKGVKKPTEKFITQMIFGIMAAKSLHLSKIARALKEDTHLNQTINRLSINLENSDLSSVYDNYLETLKPSVNNDTLFIIDDTEIIKPRGTSFEALGYVRDGSSSTRKLEKGYHACEIVMVGDNKQPKSVYSHIYSELERGFESSNRETFKGLDKTINAFGNVGTYILDRGFDADKYYEYFIKEQVDFIIRSKKNRKVIYKGKKRSIDYVVNNYKGRVNMTIMFQNEAVDVRVSHAKIRLSCSKENLYLVVVHGLGKNPFKLITNKQINSRKDVIKVVLKYLSRWRVEEYFKFKKQSFNFEDFRVRKLSSIRNINLLLSLTTSFISDLVKVSEEETVLAINIKSVSRGLKE